MSPKSQNVKGGLRTGGHRRGDRRFTGHERQLKIGGGSCSEG